MSEPPKTKHQLARKARSDADKKIIARLTRVAKIEPDEYEAAKDRLRHRIAEGENPWDDVIYGAMVDRRAKRLVPDANGKHEHPTARAFRLGIKSIRAGRPSEQFLLVLEQIGTHRKDVLHLLFPQEFRPVIARTIEAADKDAQIVAEFRQLLETYRSRKVEKHASFPDAKREFKGKSKHSEKAVDRALESFAMNWPARGRDTKIRT